MVHDLAVKKLFPDSKFTSHFIRNTSDLNLKNLFLYSGHYCTVPCFWYRCFDSRDMQRYQLQKLKFASTAKPEHVLRTQHTI